jgi:hypothetical protein
MTHRSKTTASRTSFPGSIPLRSVALAGALILSGLAGTAQGQDLIYGRDDEAGYAGGFGGPLIRGDYVGAPFTRVPRPSELVPGAWGYGTYGIPTVAGIRSAPAGTPTVYVIDAPRSVARAAAPGRSRVLTRNRQDRWSAAPGDARSQAGSRAFQAQGGGFQAAPPAGEMSGGARVVPVRVSHR